MNFYRENFSVIAKNISWLFLGRIYYLFINTFASIFIVRYLGPENNGIYSYVIAFSSLFSGLSIMGLDNILIKEFCDSKKNKRDIFIASFIIRCAGTALAYLIMLIAMYMLKIEHKLQMYILFTGITLIANAFSGITGYFYSKSEAKYIVIAESITYSISFFVKIILIIFQFPLQCFIIIYVSEITMTILIEWLIFYFKERQELINIKNERIILEIRSLFMQGWPIILGSVANMIYLKSDQIMIGEFLNNRELGIYSVAVKLAEVWYFIPNIIAAAVLPQLTRLKMLDFIDYERKLQKYMSIFVGVGYLTGILMTLLSRPIIYVIFGSKYIEAAPILCIYIWAGVFINMSVLRGQYYVIMNMTKYSMWTNLIGAITNILLNALLIPKMGGIGSALATLVSYALYAYFSSFFFKKLHRIAIVETKAIALIGIREK